MLSDQAIVLIVFGSVAGLTAGSLLVFFLKTREAREIEKRTSSERLRAASELRRLRKETILAREALRKADEKWKGVLENSRSQIESAGARELEAKRESDDLKIRLIRREQDVRVLQQRVSESFDSDRAREYETRIQELMARIEALRDEGNGIRLENQRLETAEREMKVMIRALENMGSEMKIRVEERDRAMMNQEAIIFSLQQEIENRSREFETTGEIATPLPSPYVSPPEPPAAPADSSWLETRPVLFPAERLEPLSFEEEFDSESPEADAERESDRESEAESAMESGRQPENAPAPGLPEKTEMAEPVPSPRPKRRRQGARVSRTSPLARIQGIGRSAIRRLESLGITSIESLSESDPKKIEPGLSKKDRGDLEKWIAEAIVLRSSESGSTSSFDTGTGGDSESMVLKPESDLHEVSGKPPSIESVMPRSLDEEPRRLKRKGRPISGEGQPKTAAPGSPRRKGKRNIPSD